MFHQVSACGLCTKSHSDKSKLQLVSNLIYCVAFLFHFQTFAKHSLKRMFYYSFVQSAIEGFTLLSLTLLHMIVDVLCCYDLLLGSFL